MPTNDHIRYSIVIPIYNESENIGQLHERLTKVMQASDGVYEIIFVNDGSKDDSVLRLLKLHDKDPACKVIDLSRNFGHQIALTAGMDLAKGDAVILMDGDLQDPPEVLPKLMDKWQEGFEVVYAIREKRKEGLFKRLAYKVFYQLLYSTSEVHIPIDAGDFGLMDRKVVDILNQLPERNRFIRGIRSWVGYKQIGVSYDRDARFAGKAKYTLTGLIKLALDGLISFSNIPLRLMVYAGLSVSAIAFLGILVTLYKRFFEAQIPPGYTTTLISVLFIGGIQLIGMGLLGEYIGRIYDEVKQRPHYLVKRLVGFEKEEEEF